MRSSCWRNAWRAFGPFDSGQSIEAACPREMPGSIAASAKSAAARRSSGCSSPSGEMSAGSPSRRSFHPGMCAFRTGMPLFLLLLKPVGGETFVAEAQAIQPDAWSALTSVNKRCVKSGPAHYGTRYTSTKPTPVLPPTPETIAV